MRSYAIFAEGGAGPDLDIVLVVVPIQVAANILKSAGEESQHSSSAHSTESLVVRDEHRHSSVAQAHLFASGRLKLCRVAGIALPLCTEGKVLNAHHQLSIVGNCA